MGLRPETVQSIPAQWVMTWIVSRSSAESIEAAISDTINQT